MMSNNFSSARYEKRYREGYMAGFDDIYECARAIAVRQLLTSEYFKKFNPKLIVDIACGQGRYVPIVKAVFQESTIVGIDIAHNGLKLASRKHSENSYLTAYSENLPLARNSVDMIFSIETLEHVYDVRKTINELARVLMPGGQILLTTPCANRFSFEWLKMALSDGFQPSADGIGRFRSDEPGHLRRMTTAHLKQYFLAVNIEITAARYRSHLFTPFALMLQPKKFRKSRKLKRILVMIASLDWLLLRRFSNAASMIVIARKAAG